MPRFDSLMPFFIATAIIAFLPQFVDAHGLRGPCGRNSSRWGRS